MRMSPPSGRTDHEFQVLRIVRHAAFSRVVGHAKTVFDRLK